MTSLRPAAPSDIDRIYALERSCSQNPLDELHILEVAVDQHCRNSGLGTLLIRQFYEKCGFSEEAVRTGYYGDGEDAVFMSIKI